MPAQLNPTDIDAYLKREYMQRNLSVSTVNVLNYAIRYYYEHVLKNKEHSGHLTYWKI